jgi:hypothetical protein
VTAKKIARDQSMLWGYSIETWDRVGVWTMIGGAAIGIVALFISFVSAYVLYRVADVAQAQLVSESKTSAERIALLNNETERLRADNLALQTVLLPRHVGLIGFDGPPKAQEWFASFQVFAGTDALIQVAPDAEAQNLANEIAIVLSKFGWNPQFIDERRSHVSLTLVEGVSVMSPDATRPWRENDPEEPFTRLANAGQALARALTAAGLGVGSFPVSHTFLPIYPDRPPMIPWFDPPLTAVLVQVGARPVSRTVQWIAQGRQNAAGVPATPISPETSKQK